MKKLLIISLLIFSVNGWTQVTDEIHERYAENHEPKQFLEESIAKGSILFPICNVNESIKPKHQASYFFESPEIITRTKTIIPIPALRQNIDGFVFGKLAIDEYGDATDVEIIYSYPDKDYFKVNFSSSRKRYKYKPAVDLESGKNIKSFLYDFQVYTSPQWLRQQRREQNLNMGGLGISYLNTLFSVWDKASRGYAVSAKESVAKKYQKENDPLKKASYFYLNGYIDLMDIYFESWNEKGNKAWSVEGDFNQQRFKSKFQSFNDTAINNLLTTRKMYTEEVDKSIYNYFNPLVLKMRFATSLGLYRLYVDSYQDDLAYEEASKNLLIKRNFGLELSDDDYAMYTFIGIIASNRKDWCDAYYAFSSANQIKDFLDKEFARNNNKRGWLFQDITAELNAKFEDKDNRISVFRDYIDDKEREKYFKKAEYEFALELSNSR